MTPPAEPRECPDCAIEMEKYESGALLCGRGGSRKVTLDYHECPKCKTMIFVNPSTGEEMRTHMQPRSSR